MAGPIHGSIEHFFAGTGFSTGSVQSAFVNLYNFFNNNTGTLGIQRIAYHTGAKETGMVNTRGMNYFDAANPAGGNAWACFCFSSASVPFYVLIQFSNSTAFGTAPGSPGLIRNATTANSVGIAFAQRADGGNPWNGSSGSNGSDTKGTPVWHPGTSSLVLMPRSNDGVRGGAHGASKQNCVGHTVGSGIDYRMHMIADYDNFVFLYDANANNNYASTLITKYTPLSGVNPQVPYVSLGDTAALPFTNVSVYGDLAGTAAQQGAIGYTTASISGTCSTAIERVGAGFFQNTNAQPNRAFTTPVFNEFPFLIGIFESPNQVGAMGHVIDFFREAYNVASHDTNNDGTRAAFGTTTVATVKLVVPWSSGTVPGSGITRGGVQF